MKILVISNYYPPYFIGGYELACKNTVEYLKMRGHTISILTGDYKVENESMESKTKDGVSRFLKYIDYINGSFLNKHIVEKENYKYTQKCIKEFKPDLIYFWSLKGVSISPVVAAKKLNQKMIFEIGDFWPQAYIKPGFSNKFKRFIKGLIPFTIGSNAPVTPAIVVSEWMKKEMIEKYGTKKCFVVPNGIELPEKIDKNYGGKIIRYMFCGRVEKDKGLDIAIKGIEKARKEEKIQDNFQLNIYGTGSRDYLDECKSLIDKYGFRDKTIFHGQVTDIQKAYVENDVLLMPTLMREAFGLVIIEAMACKMSVISTNKYGPAEIITNGENGFLTDAGSIDQMADCISRLHNDQKLREDFGEKGRKLVEDNYDIKIVKSRIEEILNTEITS